MRRRFGVACVLEFEVAKTGPSGDHSYEKDTLGIEGDSTNDEFFERGKFLKERRENVVGGEVALVGELYPQDRKTLQPRDSI